ncbi:MAG TPA: response regulator transcription factor [Candidatus Aphodovivens avistercoris]|nr:response regulator transcription factor [Candidatus Aphodovivens avistercoris]
MRILVADDERDLTSALEALLKHEHYLVDAVYDGESAYEYGLSGNYDCIILDIMLPGIDGLEVLRRLRGADVRTPILLLTAKSDPSDRILGLDRGADDYLPKPFVTGELLARIRALTRRSATLETSALSFGDLTLDRTAFQLRCGSSAEHLGNKEFQLMETLIRRQGSPVSVEQLMDRIWGYDASVEPGVVWTYMSYLRRKLESLGSRVRVTMRRGFGYVLEEAESKDA